MSDPLTSTEAPKVEAPLKDATSASPVAGVAYADIQGLLGVTHPDGQEQSQLERISAWLKDKSPVERLTAIRHLETRLGAPKIGQTRLSNIHQYVKLQGQIKELEGARDSLLA